jgi:cytidine deaminase
MIPGGNAGFVVRSSLQILTVVGLLLLGSPVPAGAAPFAPLRALRAAGANLKARVVGWGQNARTLCRLGAIDPLLPKAFRAMQKAHSPYSGAHNGAAVQWRRGGLLGRIPGFRTRVLRGFNSESAGDLQLCAERAAMAEIPRGQAKKNPVRKIAVVADKSLPRPCGRCLQVLSEVGSPETEVVAASVDGQSERFRLKELLPRDFAPVDPARLRDFQPLITTAVRDYRRALRRGVNQYRPAFGAAIETGSGRVYRGVVIKETACTFTPATQEPLERIAQRNALEGLRDQVRTVVIVGRGRGRGGLPIPTGDERQHLLDVNPEARVVLYNPDARVGTVLQAAELLPHAYSR